jgi:hypothetical protein
MSAKVDDGCAYEWAEFNLPLEAVCGPGVPSPLARRISAAAGRKATAANTFALPDWPQSSATPLLVPSFLARP